MLAFPVSLVLQKGMSRRETSGLVRSFSFLFLTLCDIFSLQRYSFSVFRRRLFVEVPVDSSGKSCERHASSNDCLWSRVPGEGGARCKARQNRIDQVMFSSELCVRACVRA